MDTGWQIKIDLIAQLTQQGYVIDQNPVGFMHQINIEICDLAECGNCGEFGMEYTAFKGVDFAGMAAMMICPKCNHASEF